MGCKVELPGEAKRLLAEFIAQLHRSLVGKGPQTVRIESVEGRLLVVLDGFLTPYEETLIAGGRNRDLVNLMRERLLEGAESHLREAFRENLHVDVTHLEGRNDFERRQRVITVHIAERT